MYFSTNEEGTCYTGALCGLGCNSQAQEGILPEHDIELAFDVKFDVEDITEVTADTRCRETEMLCLTGDRNTDFISSDLCQSSAPSVSEQGFYTVSVSLQ